MKAKDLIAIIQKIDPEGEVLIDVKDDEGDSFFMNIEIVEYYRPDGSLDKGFLALLPIEVLKD